MSVLYEVTGDTPAASLLPDWRVSLNNPNGPSEYRKVRLGDLATYFATTNLQALTATFASGAVDGSIRVSTAVMAAGTPVGDTRGNGAVDLQVNRASASQVASGNYAVIVGGNNNTATGAQAVVIGGQANLASGNFSSVGGGANNLASKTNSSVGGGSANTASGTQSYVGGGVTNTASGQDSAVAGGNTNKASGISSAVGGGSTNTASGTLACIGGGGGNSATSTYCTISGGQNNTATAFGATIGGGSDNGASGLYSWIPGGWQARAPLYGQESSSSGQFAAAADCQRSMVQARITTTDATPTALFLDGTSRRILIPSGYIWAFTAHITGVKDDGLKGCYYIRQGLIINNGGTTSLIGTVQTVGTDIETDAGLNAAVTADDTNDALDIQVTGIAASNFRWQAIVHFQQTKIAI